MADEDFLGEFSRGPAAFGVYRISAQPPAYRVGCVDSQQAGPCEVCRFEGDGADGVQWRGAWNGDQWCPWILIETHKVINSAAT